MAWHHILPQFFLRGFVDPSTPPGHEPYVWTADLLTGKIKPRAPRKAARIIDYYRVDTSVDRNLDPDGAERRLSVEEGKAAADLRAFLQSPSDRRLFRGVMRFVALLGARTPWLRRRAERDYHASLLTRGELTLRSDVNRDVGIIDESTGVARRIRLSEALPLLHAGRARATMLPNQHLAFMWEQWRFFERVHFPRMKWTVLRADAPSLVTSDRAVAWYVPGSDYGATDSPGALRISGAEVTVALTPTIALLGIVDARPEDPGEVDLRIVNERAAALAERFVIASSHAALKDALAYRERHLALLAEARSRCLLLDDPSVAVQRLVTSSAP